MGLTIVLGARITYAYFYNTSNDGDEQDVVAGTETTDDFRLSNGNVLSLEVSPTTLPENGANLVTESFPQATLLANSSTNEASFDYDVNLTISNNTFTYTTAENTAEIILTIIGPDDVEITNIENLTYTTVGGASGFDITTFNGVIPIATNYEITSNSSTEKTIHDWTIRITYVNMTTDQSANLNKSLNTTIALTTDETITE